MRLIQGLILFSFSIVVWSSCSKKTQPEKTTTVIVTKPVAKPKAVVPKVITVNDQVAGRSVDGRLYYDLQGRRYWRNRKDGKYYLFNKNMFSNPDFNP